MFIPPHHAKQFGFTFVELMITVAIIGILVAIAMPSYRQYILRSNRAAAQAEMMDIANRQQQFFLANRSYATTLADMSYVLPHEVSERYRLNPEDMDVDNTARPPHFTITFVTKGSQDGDGNLTLDSTGTKLRKNGSDCWAWDRYDKITCP